MVYDPGEANILLHNNMKQSKSLYREKKTRFLQIGCYIMQLGFSRFWLVSDKIAERIIKSEMMDSGPRQDHTPILLEIRIYNIIGKYNNVQGCLKLDIVLNNPELKP